MRPTPDRFRRLCFSLLALFLPLLAAAQPPALVVDLNQTQGSVLGSAPHDFVALGERIVFTATEPSTGVELWASDGTPEGTELLADAEPGPGDPYAPPSAPRYLGSARGVFFWAKPSVETQTEVLWRTDGTAEGTFPLTPLDRQRGIGTGSGFDPRGRLFFLKCGSEGVTSQLWTSDGTVAGTRVVRELAASNFCSIAPVGAFGDRVFFAYSAAGPAPGTGLWVSDGTRAGTRLVKAFSRGIYGLVAARRSLFFEACTDGGCELWASDGTRAGTRAITSFETRAPFTVQVSQFTYLDFLPLVIGDQVVVAAHDRGRDLELWASDGPQTPARRLTDLTSVSASLLELAYRPSVARLGGRVVFPAAGVNGRELWSTDGTPESTTEVLDVCPGPCSGVASPFYDPFVTAGGRVFFRGNDGTGRDQLWVSDGTAAGTLEVTSRRGGFGLVSEPVVLAGDVYFIAHTSQRGQEVWKVVPEEPLTAVRVTDLGLRKPFPLPPFSDSLGPLPRFLGVTGERVVFAADDGRHGTELWASMAEPETTTLVADLAQEHPGSSPRSVIDLGGRAIFTAFDGVGEGVWASDGSAGTTVRLTPASLESPCASRRPEVLTRMLNVVFFLCAEEFPGKDQIWRTDGTPAGTLLLSELAEPSNASVFFWTPFGFRLYFPVSTLQGEEVWQTDGTPAGTRRAFGLENVPHTSIEGMVATTDALYVVTAVYDDEIDQFRWTLWRSDGTEAGTVRLLQPEPGVAIDSRFLTPVGKDLYFIASSAEGSTLGRTDGTPAGTIELAGLGGRFVSRMTAHRGAVALLAYHDDDLLQPVDLSLWASDGTPAGTRLIAEVGRVQSSVNVAFGNELTAIGESLFFRAEDAEHGVELWVSDGTSAGTRVVRDLVPGVASSLPRGLVAAGDKLFFSATDGVTGFELWESDGTAEGTRQVSDLRPGMLSSVPQEIAQVGSRLYWSADDGVHGRELWSLGGL